MTDRYDALPPGIRLPREDHEWLAKFARREDTSVQSVVNHALWFFRYWQAKGKKTLEEALETIDLLHREHEKQVRRCRYFEREYKKESRRLHNMRREYEKRLSQERGVRRQSESQLRRERSMRRACEQQLELQPSCHEHNETTTESHRDALYSPTVAKLLALAVCSESEGEAKVAFMKARTLHRQAALTSWLTPGPQPRYSLDHAKYVPKSARARSRTPHICPAERTARDT